MSVTKVENGPDPQQREKVYRLLIAVLVAVLIVSWFFVVWGIQGKNSAQDDVEDIKQSYAAGPDAQAEAERMLGEMISFDYRDIGNEYEWTKYLRDDELRSQYEDSIIPKLTKVIRKTKSAADGEVVQSAYDQIDEDHVDVLAFIRQTLTDVKNKDGVLAEQWASLSMSRDDDGWLIDKIDIVSVPPPS